MITKKQARLLKDKIKRVVDAEVADSWKGSRYPDEFPPIEQELKEAQADLDKYIKYLTLKG